MEAFDSAPRRSAPLITGLTLVLLVAIAYAIPRGRIEADVTGVQRGLLVGPSRFSDQLAEIVSRDGYNFLAIDLTEASHDPNALWVGEFDEVARIFEVWGWVDARRGLAQAKTLTVPLKGLFLYAATPAQVEEVRRARPGLRVVPVAPPGAQAPADGGLALRPGEFAARAGQAGFPVLLAAGMDTAALRALRAKAEGSYLVVSVTVPE